MGARERSGTATATTRDASTSACRRTTGSAGVCPDRPARAAAGGAWLAADGRGAAEHAVEMAVARLRVALGGSAFVQTVVKRGYRLRVD